MLLWSKGLHMNTKVRLQARVGSMLSLSAHWALVCILHLGHMREGKFAANLVWRVYPIGGEKS